MRKILIMAVVAIFSFTACGGDDNLSIENTKWNLTQLYGAPHEAFADADTFWFSLDGESIVGVGACNRFFGGYQLNGNSGFKIGGMGMTRMACPDMELEDTFVRLFDEVDNYAIEDENLLLKRGDEVVARFAGEPVVLGEEIPQS